MKNKSADELLEEDNFRNANGVYATNPHYEVHLRARIGLMDLRRHGKGIQDGVGLNRKNDSNDVKFVGIMLYQLGFISKTEVTDPKSVTRAISKFQNQVLAPAHENWYKARDKAVTNSIDRENLKTQRSWLTDSAVDPNAKTLGVLYYMTYLKSHIPNL